MLGMMLSLSQAQLQWRADGALVAVFTERHAKTALEQVKLGRDLLPIYENLIDRLTLLASGHGNLQAENEQWLILYNLDKIVRYQRVRPDELYHSPKLRGYL